MKKLVLLFALCAFYCTDFTAQQIGGGFPTNPTGPTIQPDNDGKAAIYIKFGRKSRDCERFGLCDVQVNLTARDIISIISAVIKKDRMHMQFPSKFVAANPKYFENNQISIDEDFQLSKEVANSLGVKSFTIKRGKYPVVFDKLTNTYNCTF